MGLHLAGLLPLALYLLGLAAFLGSIFWRPDIGIYYIVPLLPLQNLRYQLHAFPLGAQSIDLMLLGILIGVLRARYPIWIKTRFSGLLLALGATTYLSLWRGAFFLNSPLPLWFDDARLSDWKNFMVIFFLFFMVRAAIVNVKQMKVLIFLMCLSILMINRSFINTMSHRDLSSFSYQLRDDGGLGYAGVNGLAALEAQFSVFLMGLYSFQRKLHVRLGLLGVLGTCLVALAYTFSRGGYGAVLLGTLFVGLWSNKKLVLILLVFLVTWQSIVPVAVTQRVFMTRDASGQLESSAGDRVTLWENAAEIIESNPAIGTGFDTYKYLHTVGGYEDTHNYYVKVTVEMGLIGLVIFVGILFQMFAAGYSLFRTRSASSFLQGIGIGLAGMLVAAAVANLFGDRWTYIEEMGFTWVLVAMAIKARQIAQAQPVTVEIPDATPRTGTPGEFERARDLALGWNSRLGSR